MAVNIKAIGSNAAPLVYNYHYDQLNRLVSMDAYSGLNTTTGSFTPIQLSTYAERAGYDPNGNITSYIRHGDAARVQMDSLTYSYKAGKNQLDNVVDNAADAAPGQYSNYNDLKQGQQAGNYQYDAIGNLTSDAQAGISTIAWTVYGKIDSISKTDGTGIKYHYDVAGNRISKVVTKGSTVSGTYYVRDAQGNVLSVYQDGSSMALTQMENHIYGSSRLGMVTALTVPNQNVALSGGNTGIVSTFTRGEKLFELSNHLGNVLVTLTDKKLQHTSDNATVDYYVADVASASDYYPFGMQMPGRNITASTTYRYGFNGKEKDGSISGSDNDYDFGARIYDARLGRFNSIDKFANKQPFNSSYSFAANRPIWAVDINGDLDFIVNYISFDQNGKVKNRFQSAFNITTTEDIRGINRTPVIINVYTKDVLVEVSPGIKYWSVKRDIEVDKNSGLTTAVLGEKFKHDDPVDYYGSKLFLGIAKMWGGTQMAENDNGRDLETGEYLSKGRKVGNYVSAVVSLATLGRGVATNKITSVIVNEILDNGIEKVSDMISENLKKKLGFTSSQSIALLVDITRLGIEAKKGELNKTVDLVLRLAQTGIKGQRAAEEIKQQTGIDVNRPKDKNEATQQVNKSIY